MAVNTQKMIIHHLLMIGLKLCLFMVISHRNKLDLPVLMCEPGRSIVATAGVSIINGSFHSWGKDIFISRWWNE